MNRAIATDRDRSGRWPGIWIAGMLDEPYEIGPEAPDLDLSASIDVGSGIELA